MKHPSYRQPEKQQVRKLVLERAVAALTTQRSTSSLVTIDEFEETLDYAIHFLQKHGLNGHLGSNARAHAQEWSSFYRATVGQKAAADLRILYLCGPEPLNDLEIFLALGIAPQNIWAIESDSGEYRKAIEQLKQSELYIRVHHGTLETFFDTTNERFDIIYIDACGALPGGRPNTLRGPLLMFHRERLAPLGVLITNFSQPSGEKRKEYEMLLGYYFAPRYNDCPRAIISAGADPAVAHYDPAYLLPYIAQAFDDTYSEFITRLIVDLGRQIIPFARIYDNPDLRKKYFASGEDLKSTLRRALASPPDVEPSDNAESYLRRFLSSTGDVTPKRCRVSCPEFFATSWNRERARATHKVPS